MTTQGTYNGTSTNATSSISTTSGSVTTPAYLSDLYVAKTGAGVVRAMTTTSGGGGVLVPTNTVRVLIGRFEAGSVIQMRTDSGSATIASSCVLVSRTR
tara:strand:- start:900 stop:1196 length:297 start_codon:yes stop_codon:yes gene_type:complete